jgi:hypothetical protein
VTGGTVDAVARIGSTVYVGGAFSYAGPATGFATTFSPSTLKAAGTFPVLNGAVTGMTPDESDGLFVSGSFTKAGGLNRSNVVHVLGNGQVDPTFTTTVGGGQVNSVAYDPSFGYLFLGGTFTSVNGVARNGVAAVDASGALVSAFTSPLLAGAGSVLRVDKVRVLFNTVYVGGIFTTSGGAANFAALN